MHHSNVAMELGNASRGRISSNLFFDVNCSPVDLAIWHLEFLQEFVDQIQSA